MKKTRRFLSLALIICLLGTLLSGVCLTASAEDGFTVTFSVPEGVTAPEALTGTSITLPTAATSNGKYKFAGWSETQGNLDSTAVLTGIYAPAADITLYAVYTSTESIVVSDYALATELPAVGDKIIIAFDSDDGYYALPNATQGSVTAIAGREITVSDGYAAIPAGVTTYSISDLTFEIYTKSGNLGVKSTAGDYFIGFNSGKISLNGWGNTKYAVIAAADDGMYTISSSNNSPRGLTYKVADTTFRVSNDAASPVYIFTYSAGSSTGTTVYTTEVPACEHSFALTNTVEATCTADEINTYTCAVCELSYTETVEGSALGHSFSEEEEPEIVKEPTCTEEGSQKRTCLNCGKKISVAIPALGHDFVGNLCTRCGEIDPIAPVTKTFTLVTSADQLGEGEYILIAKAYIKPAAEPEEGEEPAETEAPEDPVSFNASYYAIKNQVGKPIHNMKAYNADALIGESIPATLTVDEEAIQWYGTYEDGALALRGYNGWDLIAKENDLDFTLPVAGSAPTAWTPTFDEEDGTFQLTYLDEGDNTRILGIRSDLKPDEEGDPHIKCNNKSSLGKTVNSSYRFYLYYKAEDCEHSSVTKVTAATCTTTGYSTNYCVLCGRINIDSFTAALGHTPNEDGTTVVDPTCTEIGTNTYVCANCGKTQVEEIPALGHFYEDGACTVCGAEEPVMQDFTRVTSVDDLADGHYVLVAKGNYKPGWYAINRMTYKTSYVAATNVGSFFEDDIVPDTISLSDTAVIWNVTVTDGTITLSGDDGNSLTTTKSNYLYYDNADATSWTVEATENGTFKLTTTDDDGKARILGVRDDLATTMADATPLFRCNAPTDTKAKTSSYEFYIYSDSVNAELKIKSASLRLDEDIDVIYKATVPAGYTDVSMTFTMNGESVTIPDDGTHTFIFEGVTPQCFGDNISATLTATLGDETFTDEIAEYSVRTYCVNQLVKDNISVELRTLLSDVLAYGAAAQTYVGYKTDALVNVGDDIVEPTYSTYTQIEGYAPVFSGEAAESPCWIAAGLKLTNSVAMTFRFYAEKTDGLTVTVSVNGRAEEFTEFTAVEGKENVYEVTFAGIQANEFNDAVTASFSNGGNTVSYSVNTYVCAKQADSNANLAALVKALYNYGVSAAAYAG